MSLSHPHARRIAAQAAIFKALGHPSRLLMADAMRSGEKCVCELRDLVGGDMSTVSRHLAVLRDAGVIVGEKRGTNIYYRLLLTCLDGFLGCSADFVRSRILTQAEMLDAEPSPHDGACRLRASSDGEPSASS